MAWNDGIVYSKGWVCSEACLPFFSLLKSDEDRLFGFGDLTLTPSTDAVFEPFDLCLTSSWVWAILISGEQFCRNKVRIRDNHLALLNQSLLSSLISSFPLLTKSDSLERRIFESRVLIFAALSVLPGLSCLGRVCESHWHKDAITSSSSWGYPHSLTAFLLSSQQRLSLLSLKKEKIQTKKLIFMFRGWSAFLIASLP